MKNDIILVMFIGLLEAFGTTLNSKFRQRNKKIASFITAIINILVWVYIISKIIENINNSILIWTYAFAYATGDVLALIFDNYIEKLAKIRGIKLKKKKIKTRKK